MTQVGRYMVALAIFWMVLIAEDLGAAEQRRPPGISDSEIKIGQTMPYSGPASAWGAVGRAELAYFKMINDQGGINGRKINLVSLDDGFSPPKTVEQTRKLVEEDGVAFMFNTLGPGNLAIRKYLNERHIPQLFVLASLETFNDPQHFPWTMGFLPTFYREGMIHARHILARKPDARIAVLYQNNDSRESVKGLRDGLGERAAQLIVKELSYEESDATIESQMVSFKTSGADTLYDTATPKFAAQAIRKAHDLGWKPLHFLHYGSQSILAVLEPAGLENAMGLISGAFAKDPADPQWKDDQNTRDFLDWIQKYYPSGSPNDIFIAAGYELGQPLVHLLRQCGADLSRENVMHQAANLRDVRLPWLLPGITLSTSPTDYQPIKKLRETRFNGREWELIEDIN